MPIPATFSQVRQTEKVTSSAREVTQTWEGWAGEYGVDLNEWLASFFGYSSVSITREQPTETGNGKCICEITFATTADGAVRPSTDADFGLVKRSWTRHANQIQEPLALHPRVIEEIVNANPAWVEVPAWLSAWAKKYTDDSRDYINAKIAGTSSTKPDRLEYFEKAVDDFSLDTTATDCAAWLFSEFVNEPSASWDFDQYVLRKSEVVTSNSVLRASDTNVGRLMTYATLATTEPTLPAYTLLASAGLESWVWLKKAPEIEAIAGGNYQIQQEYWGFPKITSFMEDRYGDVL